MMSETLIIFTRYPIPGKTKTRLISALGADGAAKVQKEMTESIVETARRVREIRNVSIEIHYAGGNKTKIKKWLGDDFIYREQISGDIGEKMNGSLNIAFNEGAIKAVLIGTDCPSITVGILQNAFEILSEKDVVLGPAKDGGYYLVGLKRECPQIFENIPWGSRDVFGKTVDILKKRNLSFSLVEKLDDIDRPEDVKLFCNERNKDR